MSDAAWTIGDTVRDRDDDDPDPDPAIVVNMPDVPADEWTVPRIQTTVAEDNPDYPADAPIVVVVFADTLEESFPEWERNDPLPITELNDEGVQHYSFPAPRLEPIEPTESTDPTTEADSHVGTSSTGETTSSTTADVTHASPSSDPTTDASSEQSPTRPSGAVRALEQRLAEGGMTTTVEADGRTIRATKLGETYRVRPGEILDGEGAFRSRLEEIVTTVDHHATN